MCGIAGAIGPDAASLTRKMCESLVHRGPDDDGLFAADGIALGARRLSIIDLDGGHQPISNETGELTLVCNGEIYNSPALRSRLQKAGHRFSTRTDIEVILHLYEEHGADCVRLLEGMFAFALWDSRERSLLLGRDHMGQKPLFYHAGGGRFLFASEIQALLASEVVPRRLDVDALWHYLSLRSMPDQYCLIEGIRKLPAATRLVHERSGRVDIQRYWQPDFTAKLSLTEGEAEEALDERLRATVASHLLSDVPVGTFLSGGIDSTTIAAMMVRQTDRQIPAFTIGVHDASYDEIPVAERVARAQGLRFHGSRVRADIATLLPTMVHHLGEPADPYAVGVYLVSQLAAEHVKVVLCGDGGDESFAGYDRYLGQRLVDYYAMLPAVVRKRVLAKLVARVPESFRYKSMAQRLAWMQAMAELDGGHRYARALGFLRFTAEDKEALFRREAVSELAEPDSAARVLRYFDAPGIESVVDRMLFTDLMTRVPDHNLVMSDRMSMACSLEVRSPFVDPRLVEFAASLPAELKLKRLRLKHLLRRVARRYLPADVTERPKQGFGFPVGRWLREDLAPLVDARLGESQLVQAGVFRQEYIDRLLREHSEGRVDHSYRLWLLLGLEIWHELYIRRRDPGDTTDEIRALAAPGGFSDRV